jgi:hypothetical protein
VHVLDPKRDKEKNARQGENESEGAHAYPTALSNKTFSVRNVLSK